MNRMNVIFLRTLLALYLTLLCGCPVYDVTPVVPDPVVPDPVVTTPIAVEGVEQIIQTVIAPISDEGISQFYGAWAEVLIQEPSLVSTNDEFRKVYERSGQIVFKNVQKKYPGLAEGIDKCLELVLGLDPNKKFDAQKTTELFRAIENALK